MCIRDRYMGHLLEKVFDIIRNFEPSAVEQPPLSLLSLFQNLEFELRFASSDEVPENLRPYFGKLADEVDKIKLNEDLPRVQALGQIIGSNVEVYFTISEFLAAEIKINLPGFTDYLSKFNA
eukprot:TRINITY_DN3746_c0_g1_i22.p2 TRINITY_DN3746_c0_g1~~TRINITY_DN3746_c0_g1_i22.p2  ORF type:complete len:122 (+),score=38.64 TRINITY_DN3746_c0_g1_i22:78-443(+)